MSKKIAIYSTAVIIFLILLFSFGSHLTGDYDKQNKIIVFLKEIIPIGPGKKVRDTLFYIPKMKQRNEYLELIVKKHEQGLRGEEFANDEIESDNKNLYSLKKFFLPFNKLDLKAAWTKVDNTLNRHYIEIVDDNLICFSGRNKIIYFPIANFKNNQLEQKEISNNLDKILNDNNYEPMGIRDIFFDGKDLYVFLFKDSNGFTVDIYKAAMNYDKLFFKLFFKSNTYWDVFSVRTGGRIQDYKDNSIIYSFGDVNNEKLAQDDKSIKGKIISINKNDGSFKILSKGHRNQQGLIYDKDLNLIINTEHGPKGGDEINLNFNHEEKVGNFGWPVASYGTKYVGKSNAYKKSHKDFGFIEPFKNYNPGLGISEIIFQKNYKGTNKNYLFVSSLRAGSIYKLQVNEDLTQIINEERIFFPGQRIRDIKYHKESESFFMLFETIPSIAFLKEKR